MIPIVPDGGGGAPAAQVEAVQARWWSCGLVAVAVGVVASFGVRGADYPAHLLRAELWERSGLSVWNLYWYGGHSTPTYSLLAPPLVALVGPLAVIAAGSLVATWCFSTLVFELLPGRTALASVTFALCCIPNAVVGRAPFALGLGVALAAVLAWQRGRIGLACLAAIVTTACSPVAGVFLLVAAAAMALELGARAVAVRPPANTQELRAAAMITGAAAAPILVLAVTFGSGGRFPFRTEQLIVSAAVAATVAALVHVRVVRIAVALTLAVSTVLYAVPNPLGGNFLRLLQHVGVPLVAYGLANATRPSRAPLAIVTIFAIGWTVEPAVVAAAQWAGDESVDADYHQPLIDEIQRRNTTGEPLGRLEIPFTDGHWESLYVALAVPSARGWERQLDLDRNPELYDPDLDLDDYRTWLDHNAVRWIAVPDVAIDEGGLAEWKLLEHERHGTDIAWLTKVWANTHWTLYEIDGYQPIVDPPATLIRQGTDDLVITTPSPATITIRYTYTDALTINGTSCLEPSDDGWTIAHLTTAGTHRITIDPDETIDPGAADACPSKSATASDRNSLRHQLRLSMAPDRG